MKNRQYRNLILNSSLLFVIASIIEMIAHECGHFVAALMMNAQNVALHHNYVSDTASDLTVAQVVFVKAAGPLVSLLIGIIFHFVCSRQRSRGLGFLFTLYMAVFGYIGIFGYMLVAPFFTSGDTGYICSILEFPMWLTVMVAVVGSGILYLLMRQLVRYFVEMGTPEIITAKETRHPFINALVLYPLMIGIAVTTLLNLPVQVPLSLIAPICSPFAILWTYGDALSKEYPTVAMSSSIEPINRLSMTWVIIFVLTVIANRLLVYGVTL